MRKIIAFTFLFSILLFSLAYAQLPYSGTSIQATLSSQDPDPVEPGQVVKVKFKIENEGAESTRDTIVKIMPNYPFTIYNDKTEKNIGKLRASSTGADAEIVEFKLKVDEKAVEEEAEIELLVQVGDAATSYTNDEFLINVQTHDAVLDITSITSDPKQIAPGETAEVSIMMKNLADSLLKDIKFKLEFDDEGLPLAPYQSSSERRISQLQSGYQNSLTFKIIADPKATSGLYKVPLNITYNDEKGNSYTVDDVLAVTVGEIPKIKAYVKKSSVLQAKKEGEVTLEIANAGSSDIRFLELYLLPSDDYQLVSTSNYFYLGDVDSDDTESEEIEVYVNKKVKVLHLPVQIKYADANNKPYQQQFDLKMNLYSSSQLKKFGVLEKNYTWLYVLIIIIIIAGFVLYKSYKKDPQKFFKRLRKLPLLNSRFNSKKKL